MTYMMYLFYTVYLLFIIFLIRKNANTLKPGPSCEQQTVPPLPPSPL